MQSMARVVFVVALAAVTTAPALAQNAPKAYLVVNLDIHDPATFAKYRDAVPAVFQKYGGRFLVAGAEPKALEGNLTLKRVAVIEFPSMEAAQQYRASSEYAAIEEFRTKAARSDIVLLQGVAPR